MFFAEIESVWPDKWVPVEPRGPRNPAPQGSSRENLGKTVVHGFEKPADPREMGPRMATLRAFSRPTQVAGFFMVIFSKSIQRLPHRSPFSS